MENRGDEYFPLKAIYGTICIFLLPFSYRLSGDGIIEDEPNPICQIFILSGIFASQTWSKGMSKPISGGCSYIILTFKIPGYFFISYLGCVSLPQRNPS